jgi:C-terminal processing protease CtpA/Prc
VYSGKKSIIIENLDNSMITQNDFGTFSISILGNYKGDSIKLEGYLKTENITGGFTGLFMRLDGENGILQFDNMMKNNINGTRAWKRYSVTLPNDKKVKKIIIGGLLTGKGKVWFDNFNVLIDGKDICLLDTVIPVIPLAKLDNEFDSGSGIRSIDTSSQTIINLYKTGKIWGLCKYFHPVIAKGDKNWDYELFRILPEINGSKNINRKLYEWINNIGSFDTLSNKFKIVNDSSFKTYMDFYWISSDSLLKKDLSKLLNQIRRSKKNQESYYFDFAKGVGNPIFKNEESYKNMSFSDPGYRLLSLYRYWNMIEYFYPNKHLIDKNWDSVLYEFIPKFIKAKTELEYKLVVLELICNIQDTHAGIFYDRTLKKFWGSKIPALKVGFVNKKLIVLDYYDVEKGKLSGLKNGDIIEKIDGESTVDLIKKRLSILSGSNYISKLRSLSDRILRTNSDSISIIFKRENKIYQNNIPAYDIKKIVNHPYKNNLSHRILDNNIGYIFPGALKRNEISTIMKKFKETKGIVIDMRCYPSDFIVFSLGKFFVKKPTPFVKFTNTNHTYLGSFKFTNPISVGDTNNSNYYSQRVAILVNEETLSQSEYSAMSFSVSPTSKIFGSKTAGANGDVSKITLPGNIITGISGIGVYYPDGRETQRIGIKPNTEIKPTINGIRNNEDEVLEKAIEWIRK